MRISSNHIEIDAFFQSVFRVTGVLVAIDLKAAPI